LCIRMVASFMPGLARGLVIILIVHQDCILTFKPECQPPVSTDLDSPMTCQFPLKRVKIPARHIHSAGTGGAIQGGHLVFQLPGVSRVDACFRAVPEELLQPRVLERLDHPTTVSLSDTEVNTIPAAL